MLICDIMKNLRIVLVQSIDGTINDNKRPFQPVPTPIASSSKLHAWKTHSTILPAVIITDREREMPHINQAARGLPGRPDGILEGHRPGMEKEEPWQISGF